VIKALAYNQIGGSILFIETQISSSKKFA